MVYENKTKKELIKEINKLKRIVSELKADTRKYEDRTTVQNKVRDDNGRTDTLLTESEEKFRMLFEEANEGIIYVDAEGNIEDANPKALDIAAANKEEIVGKHFAELIESYNLDIDEYMTIFEDVLEGKDIDNLEIGFVNNRGEKITFLLHPNLIKKDDEIKGISIRLEDITKRKQAESALLDSEKQLHTIFDSVSDGVAFVDRSARIKKINQRIEDIGGYTKDEIVGKSIMELTMFSQESLEEMIKNYETILLGADVAPFEVQVTTKHGEKKDLWLSVVPVIKDDGLDGLVVSLRDVTKVKQAEVARKRSEMKYRLITENTQDLIAICDIDGYYEYVSPSHKQLGYNQDELIGKSGMNFVHPDDMSRMLQMLDVAVSNKNKADEKVTLEFRARDSSDNWHYLDSTVNPIMDDEGNISKILFISKDVTDRKAAERKIIEERNRAELNLDILNHDISNLNQMLISTSELLLRESDLPASVREYTETLLNHSRTISGILENVRKLSNVNDAELKLKEVNLSEILNNSIERIKRTHKDKKIRISNMLPDESITVFGNELLLDVFDNIFSNAVKYNQNDVIDLEILFSFIGDGRICKLQFLDNGPGIPDDYKDNIFKRFSRGESTVPGSGLGMTIAYEVVSRLGGRLWVEDRIKGDSGKGSNFVVLLQNVESGSLSSYNGIGRGY